MLHKLSNMNGLKSLRIKSKKYKELDEIDLPNMQKTIEKMKNFKADRKLQLAI